MKILFIILCFSFFSHARMLSQNESQLEVEESISRVHVRKNFLYDYYHKITYNIISERARERLSLYTLQFNPDIEDLNLVSAYVLTKDKQKIPVNRDLIQVKDVSNSAKGFSTLKEFRIPFQSLQLGSQLVVESKLTAKKLRLDDFYSFRYYFLGWGYLFKNESIELTSEVPIYFESYDPNGKLSIIKSKNKWLIKLKKTDIYYIVDEPNRINETQKIPSVLFSTQKDWKGFSHVYSKQITPRLKEPLPNELKKVVSSIKANSKDKWIEKTLEYILDNYTYLGDWRPVKGAYLPRSLQEITASKYGDCKDFSFLTIKILEALGEKAYPALIRRDYYPDEYQFRHPDVSAFNHMIVAYERAGEIIHLDPTNQTVFDNHIPADIDNRFVLNVTPVPQGLTKTRAISPSENQVNIIYHMSKLNNKKKEAQVRMSTKLYGQEAHRIFRNMQQQTLSEVKEDFLESFINFDRVKRHKFSKFPKPAKVVDKNGIDIQADITITSPFVKTSLGEGLVSTRAFYLPNIIDIENFEKGLVSDYWINKPLLFTREIIYPIISFKGQLPESCRVSTDFFTVNTTYKKIENKIVRRDQIKITQSILPNNMFKNKIFREQVQKAQDCTDPLVLVL